MKTYKQQLTDLLCTVKSVDEQIKKLTSQCLIKYTIEYGGADGTQEETSYFKGGYDDDDKICHIVDTNRATYYIDEFEIIGNPIEYHHLMMYCESKEIKINILHIRDSYQKLHPTIVLKTKKGIRIDNTKPLSEQSEEVYEKLLIALKELNL